VIRRSRCPSAVGLERAYWDADADVRAHADGCPRCAAQWSEIAALADAARHIAPMPSSRQAREGLRTALLSTAEPGVDRAPRRRPWLVLAPLAAAVAAAVIALAWWSRPPAPPPPRAAPAAAGLLAHGDAHYLITGAAEDEIVRLVSGTLTIATGARDGGEPVRVVTAAGEVEAAGAMFDVSADADRLSAVRVIYGAVTVLTPGAEAHTLAAGALWVPPPRPVDPPLPATATATTAASPAPPAPPAPRRGRSPRREVAELPPVAEPPTPEPVAAPTPEPPPPRPARHPAQQAFDDGWAALRRGDFDRAAAAFEPAARGGAGAIAEDAAFWRAVALARAGRVAAAAQALDTFLISFPASAHAAEASAMLGWLLVQGGDLAAAERRFRAALAATSPRVRASARAGLEAVRTAPPR